MDNLKNKGSLIDKRSKPASKRRKASLWAIMAGILIITVVACAVYVHDYYHADNEAIAGLLK